MADWFELSETDVLDGLGTGRQGIGELKKGLGHMGKMYCRRTESFSGGRCSSPSLRTCWSLS